MPNGFIRNRPVLSFYLLTFGISWGLAAAVYAAIGLSGGSVTANDGLLLFPLMLLGPFVSGLTMTQVVDGREGLRRLAARLRRWRIGIVWFGIAGFLVPGMMVAVLELLRFGVAPTFAPSFFAIGFFFGVPPGLLEEFGWTGFALPKLLQTRSPRASALVIGPLWGLWHLPVIDFLGAAYPHGGFWLPYFLAFIAILSAVRVLIVWVVSNTGSLLAAQLLHIGLTGGLVLLSPGGVLPWEEAGWYAVFGATLWAVAIFVAAHYGPSLHSAAGSPKDFAEESPTSGP